MHSPELPDGGMQRADQALEAWRVPRRDARDRAEQQPPRGPERNRSPDHDGPWLGCAVLAARVRDRRAVAPLEPDPLPCLWTDRKRGRLDPPRPDLRPRQELDRAFSALLTHPPDRRLAVRQRAIEQEPEGRLAAALPSVHVAVLTELRQPGRAPSGIAGPGVSRELVDRQLQVNRKPLSVIHRAGR